MKKFFTAALSLVLAGTMTAGLAACGGNGGGNGGTGGGGQTEAQKWATMVDGLKNLDNYTATETSTSGQGLKFNGEYVTAETVYSEDETEQMMKSMFAQMFMENMGMDENPYGYDSESVAYADFANGKYAMTSHYDEEKFDYVLVDGTSVKEYSLYFDREEDEYEGYYVSEYKGYKNAAQAKSALKENENPLAYMLTMEFTGVGDKADVKGTIPELFELFTYNSSKSAYVAQLGTVGIGMVPDGTPISMEVKVSNGKVVGYIADIALDMSIADMMAQYMDADDEEGEMPDMSAMYEGLSFEVSIVSEVNISNIGSTTVTVPADLDEQIISTYTDYVIADENAYKAMFDGLMGDNDTISMSISQYPESHTAYYNGELGLLKIVEANYETNEKSAKVYWATEEGLKVYTADYSAGYFDGWSEPETETISGDKNEALIALLPAEMQLYFNLDGKNMSEQFDIFEVSYYTNYSAVITFNEKEYELSISYNYSESKEKLYFNEYSLREVGTHDDVYVYIRQSDMEQDDGLPEVDGEEVTEDEWKALVEPWYNLKNVTITNGSEKTLVDIAEDGNSGKIYHITENEYNSWYIVFEKNGDIYTVTRYYFNETGMDYETWTPTGEWVKKTINLGGYNDVLDAASLTIILQLGGEALWDADNSKLATIGDLWASVKYNPMTGTYDLEEQNISLRFGQGMLVYNGYNVLSDKGTTVAGEIPEEIAAAEDVNAAYIGVYKDTANDSIVLTLNADGTFTLVGIDGQPTIEGNWSFEGWGFDFVVTTNDVELFLNYMNYDEDTKTIQLMAGETYNLQKVED